MQYIDVEAAVPNQRIARCRGTMQQAAGDLQRTAEFEFCTVGRPFMERQCRG
jgi:hypothetical protein